MKELVLVTGGTGFIGAHCIVQLLEQGYRVRTTPRSLNRKNDVIEMLQRGGVESFEQLSLTEAAQTGDANWEQAVQGCDYVLHVASPLGVARRRCRRAGCQTLCSGSSRCSTTYCSLSRRPWTENTPLAPPRRSGVGLETAPGGNDDVDCARSLIAPSPSEPALSAH